MFEIVYTQRVGFVDLDVIECGEQQCVPEHSFGPAVRHSYFIHYIISGKGYFRLGNQEFTLGQGQAFVILPDILTYYKADASDPWHYTWVAFQGTQADVCLGKAGWSSANPVKDFGTHLDLQSYFSQMMKADHLFKSREYKLTGLLNLLLADLMEENEEEANIPKGFNRKLEYVEKAISFIQTNYMKKIGISDVAGYIGLDAKYFCLVFKEHVKISPYQYLIGKRMDKACELMRNPLLSISDISRSVGYEDPLLFSKIFKKVKAFSPREFRKKYIMPQI